MSHGRIRRPEGGANLYSLPTSFVAVDTETTGLDFDLCNIIEIGAVKVNDGQIVDSFKTLIKVDEKLPPFIVHLTGITDEMLSDAPSHNEVMTDFDAFVGDSILLAHNASFDMNFLYTAYERALGKPLRNDYVDTLRVARRALPQLQHRTLPDLCEAFEVVNEGEHRAYGDALATVQCYLRMREMVIENFGDEATYASSFLRGSGSGSHLKAKDIVATADDIDEGNPLFGMRCVFTGAMTSMVRADAMLALKNVGGEPQDTVRKDTDYLVVGNDGYSSAIQSAPGKIKKAQANQLKGLPIQIISEDTFLAMLEG
jgi:exonuclease, DNA polymerase III, epsilon subunit family